jgi:hypothetical protein
VGALLLAWGLFDHDGLQASRQHSASSPRDPAPAAHPSHARPLARLTAHVKNAQAPSLWARAHRLMALGAADAPTDLDFCAGRLRPATPIAPFPHWFDADDDDEALRVDKSESHEGQLLLAFVSQVGTTASFRRTGKSTINTLVRGEQSRHLYATFVKAINDTAPDLVTGLAEAQREARGSSSPQAHGRVRARQRELADLDLTWFVEAVALDLAQRGRPLDEGWTDQDGCALSLPALLDAQLALLALHDRVGGNGFLAERGVHTAGMLLRVSALMRLAGGGREEARARQLSEIGRAWLTTHTRRLFANDAPSTEEHVVMAHVLEILNCHRLNLRRPSTEGGYGETAAALEGVLDNRQKARSDLDFVLATHLLHALRMKEGSTTDRGTSPLSLLSACASI